MGFSITYRSIRPVPTDAARAVEKATDELCRGRTWLSCEPIKFYPDQDDGYLLGSSKPNFMPDPADAASAAREGLPDGTPRDLLDILCQLSRDHGVDWQISHDYSNGPVGYIRAGVCDDAVRAQIEAFAELGNVLADGLDGLEDEAFNSDEEE